MNTNTGNIDEIFAWKDQYNIGVEAIDTAHIRLFTLVRRLLKNLMVRDYEKNKRTCIEAIKYLKQYTVQHFAQEEAYQQKIGYGGYINHKRIHDCMRDVTIPALEKQMEDSDYSQQSVEHLAGVCAAWLSSHIMLEDQAIVGRTRSKWGVDIEGNYLTYLQNQTETFMKNIFGLKAEAENLNYDGYEIGKSFYYCTVYQGENNIIYRATVALNRALVCDTLGELTGRAITTLDEVTLSMVGELTRSMCENFLQNYSGGNVKLVGDGMVNKDRFINDFRVSHPEISILWNTPKGRIAFCVKSKAVKSA